jgi:rare lipoprotein A
MRRAACWPVALAAAALAACGTAPAPRGDAGKSTVPATPPAAPSPAPPRDLAAIPDAVPRAEPRSRYGNPASYVVFGRRHYVLASAKGYVERGTASWYGPGFHAARTSSGEPYDMYAMTAAHKTLPIPAYARVTNLRNGRSVVVRINDRGPFVGDRLIDLSYTAAWKLDMLRTGTAPVEVRVLSPDGDVPPARTASAAKPGASAPAGSPLPPLAATAGGAAAIAAGAAPRTMLQAGAFFSEAGARNFVAQLAASGIGNAVVRSSRAGRRTVWQVRVGPLDGALEVDDMLERLRLAGVANARRVLE